MKIGIVGLCFVIVFLTWLLGYIPAKHKQVWTRRKVRNLILLAIIEIGYITKGL